MFNYCIGNPAFNVAEKNNVAGTGGNTMLYKTATRYDFDNRLNDDGTLIYITLKGIIPDLISGYFKNYQINFIHLMDNIDVWPYNTCFFSITKSPRTSLPKILGGMATKIFTIDQSEFFPFVYYSGSNNGMNKFFGPNKKNKVIRKLPGRNQDTVLYDYTDAEILSGPKFAFSVMESKKSYTVTDEPIYGGTICYIPTNTIDEAEKLKLFVEKNPIFLEYVKRMKFRGHAFGLRHVKKFNLNQIKTGLEIPNEWNITEKDLIPPLKFENNITEDRDRVKALGEVFTPTSLVNYVLNHINNKEFSDPNNNFMDSMCGDGQFLIGVVNKKIINDVPSDKALSSVFGIDLTESNIENCIDRLSKINNSVDLSKRLVCADSFSTVFTRLSNKQ